MDSIEQAMHKEKKMGDLNNKLGRVYFDKNTK